MKRVENTYTRRELIKLASGFAALGITGQSFSQIVSSGGKDLIILIPGITGSVLKEDGKDLWSPSAKGLGKALLSLGDSLQSLKIRTDENGVEISDDVYAEGVVQDLHIIPGLWKIDGYSKISQEIKKLNNVHSGVNFFEFSYDWRRDNRQSAKNLEKVAQKWLKDWQKLSKNEDAELVILAHSMGGLVSRYYLEVLDGWKNTKSLITFGTPYRGSVNALKTLSEGTVILPRTLNIDLTELTRSFNSIYQLLPTYPVISDGSKTLKKISEVPSLSNIDQKRVASAQKFHDEISKAIDKNMLIDDYVSRGYNLIPIVGISQKTLQMANLTSGGKLDFFYEFENGYNDGDGTVPRPSATPYDLEGKQTEIFVCQKHSTLQNANSTIDKVKGIMSDESLDWDAFRNENSTISLEMDSIIEANSDFEISGNYSKTVGKAKIVVDVTDAYSDKLIIERKSVSMANGEFKGVIGKLPFGAYRVSVELIEAGGLEIRNISDICLAL